MNRVLLRTGSQKSQGYWIADKLLAYIV